MSGLGWLPTRDLIRIAAPLLNGLMHLRFIYGNDDDEFVAVRDDGALLVLRTDYTWRIVSVTEMTDDEIRAEWDDAIVFDHAVLDGYTKLIPTDLAQQMRDAGWRPL